MLPSLKELPYHESSNGLDLMLTGSNTVWIDLGPHSTRQFNTRQEESNERLKRMLSRKRVIDWTI